jgi:methionine-gamma-lyase
MKKSECSFESAFVQEVKSTKTTEPHVLPIYATSSFQFQDIDEGIKIFENIESGHVYSRYANPTVDAVANKIAALESFDLDIDTFGIMTSSGMSAISTLFSALLNTGDKILTQGNIYGGTTELFNKVFSRMGIEPVFISLADLAQVKSSLASDKSIKAIFFETPSNPTLNCVDISEISKIAKENEVFTIIDNTFCTPYLQQPFKFGVDFIIHSTTKYLNGHGNSIAGIIVGKDEKDYRKKVWQTMKLMGTNCNPFDAWLVHNGMKTLPLRMEKHSSNAMALAVFLESHEKVNKVNYVGLKSHPDHSTAIRQMRNFGGMLSFDIKGGMTEGIKLMNQVKFCKLAPTLGDVDTLILHPASMSHLNIPRAMRELNGITDGLIRVSVGIENSQDIIEDIANGLAQL